MHYQIMTRTILAAALLLAAACGDGGTDDAPAGDDGAHAACVDAAECMIDECSDEYATYIAECGCNEYGMDCTTACDDQPRDAVLECFFGCEISDADDDLEGQVIAAFRACYAGSADECSDAMDACGS